MRLIIKAMKEYEDNNFSCLHVSDDLMQPTPPSSVNLRQKSPSHF